jgi:serine/threonine protein kinase
MLTPDTILQGRYRIVRQLGQGGMGAVYEAIDQRLDTTVALKETLFADERLRKQFEREARLLARLHHPALPRVSDHFSEADGQFLVMQFVQGDDLSEMMMRKRAPFPANQVLTWADQLLDALDYLHTQDPQIVHRDIKPQNLKLTSRGQIILLDFGLAKGQAGDISRVTTSASIFGYTPNYAPLEQIQGMGTDSRSDLYSLGATIYHLMTGTKPPDALTRAAALVNGQPDPLLKPSEANVAIASELDQVLMKAMAQSREQRYATAADMRNALHGADQASTVVDRGEAQTVLFPPPPSTVVAPVNATTQTVVGQPTVAATSETTVVRPRKRSQVVPIVVSAAVLLLVACGALGFYMLQHKRNEPVMQVTVETPSPIGGPAVSSPSPNPVVAASPELPAQQTPTATPKRSPRNEEARKEPTPQPKATAEANAEAEGHEEEPPDVPVPPNFDPNRRPRPRTRVLPVIRNLPDGSQIITMPDGMRVIVKDGKRTVLSPPRPRRQPAPSPSP